jgi:hypothetical protein
MMVSCLAQSNPDGASNTKRA